MTATLALTGFTAFVVLDVGVRMLVQGRRTGDTGLRHTRDRPDSLRWWAHLSQPAAGRSTHTDHEGHAP